MTDTLLQEVDADVRAERLAQAWQQWRKPIAVFCVALVLGTAGAQIWHHHQQAQGAKWFAGLARAQQQLTQDHAAEAADAFGKVAADASGDARTIAFIWQGRAALAADKKPDAIAAFKAASEAKPSLWSDIGCLRLASLDMAQAGCLASPAATPLKHQRQLWHAAGNVAAGKTLDALAALDALAQDETMPDEERAEAARWAASVKAAK